MADDMEHTDGNSKKSGARLVTDRPDAKENRKAAPRPSSPPIAASEAMIGHFLPMLIDCAMENQEVKARMKDLLDVTTDEALREALISGVKDELAPPPSAEQDLAKIYKGLADALNRNREAQEYNQQQLEEIKARVVDSLPEQVREKIPPPPPGVPHGGPTLAPAYKLLEKLVAGPLWEQLDREYAVNRPLLKTFGPDIDKIVADLRIENPRSLTALRDAGTAFRAAVKERWGTANPGQPPPDRFDVVGINSAQREGRTCYYVTFRFEDVGARSHFWQNRRALGQGMRCGDVLSYLQRQYVALCKAHATIQVETEHFVTNGHRVYIGSHAVTDGRRAPLREVVPPPADLLTLAPASTGRRT